MSWRTTGGHDVWTLLGMSVVAIAAAVLSFASLQDLAQRAGYPPGLAALLPIAIDAQAVVATRAWLAATTPPRGRRYARTLALSAVGLSVVGNAGQHAMAAVTMATPWWVVVAIASVPPIALAATAHLAALLARQSTPNPSTAERSTVEVSADAAAADVDPVESTHDTPPHVASELRESRPTRRTSTRSVPGRSMEALRAEFAAAIEGESTQIDPTSAESIRKTLRCSAKRARQLRDEHEAWPRLAVVGEQH